MGKKVLKFFLILSILGAICIGSYIAFKYFVYGEVYTARPIIEVGSILDKIRDEHEENIYKPNENVKQRPYSVLLVGLDSGNMDAGRSDTLMVALVDPINKKAHLLSIPRDTYVKIAGRSDDKITHAHNYGINSSIMTVEDFLDIKIDYYAKVNFDGFQSLVDTIGGITVNVEKDLGFKDRITGTYFTLNKGEQRLNGIQALNYARFRSDGEGDFGRNRRQQQVVKAIFDESLSFRNITKIKSIMNEVGKNVETDVDFDVLAKTLTKMKSVTSENIVSIKLDAYPDSVNGMSIVRVKDESLEEVKQYVREVLESKNPEPIQ